MSTDEQQRRGGFVPGSASWPATGKPPAWSPTTRPARPPNAGPSKSICRSWFPRSRARRMTDTQRPWDRLTPDSDPAYEACAAYLDTGSLRDAYRQRSGNDPATPSHRRDSQSASRHAAIREQRQRLREHLIHPGVLERHQVRALHLRLAPKFLPLRCHVVPGRAFRDVRDLPHRPFKAHAVLVGVRLRPVLCQLLRDRPVARASQPILHRRHPPHRKALGFPLRPWRDRLGPRRPLAHR